jgi:hypothetical protein
LRPRCIGSTAPICGLQQMVNAQAYNSISPNMNEILSNAFIIIDKVPPANACGFEVANKFK